jgi:serine protease inhibitor
MASIKIQLITYFSRPTAYHWPLKWLTKARRAKALAKFNRYFIFHLYIGLVIHKVYVDVDEEGTEAAAATGMSIIGSSIAMEKRQPKIFNAYHPFIFGIVHEEHRHYFVPCKG